MQLCAPPTCLWTKANYCRSKHNTKKLKPKLKPAKRKQAMLKPAMNTVTVRFYIAAYDDDDELPLSVLRKQDLPRFTDEINDLPSLLPFHVTQGKIKQHRDYFETTYTSTLEDAEELNDYLEVYNDKSVYQSPPYEVGDTHHFIRIRF